MTLLTWVKGLLPGRPQIMNLQNLFSGVSKQITQFKLQHRKTLFWVVYAVFCWESGNLLYIDPFQSCNKITNWFHTVFKTWFSKTNPSYHTFIIIFSKLSPCAKQLRNKMLEIKQFNAYTQG